MNITRRIASTFSAFVVSTLLILHTQSALAQSVGEGVNVINLNDWGSGFNVTFEYEITPNDVVDDLVRDWRIEIDYSGAGTIGNPYMTGYSGTVTSGFIAPDGGFAITNEGVGYRSELDAGFKLQFTVQGQGAGFNASDFAVEFVNLTKLPTNQFSASLVSVNDWYNPSWGGGFNATFRCDVLGPDAQIGPVTDLLINFNYTGGGTPTQAWTQSHNGTIETGFIAPDGGYAIQNLNGFQPELYAGDSITFAIQVQDAGFNESDFDIQCSSGGVPSEPVNNAPVANPQALSVQAGDTVSITLSGSDADGDALIYAVTDGPANGSVSGTAPNLTYIANSGFTGSDQFIFSVNDGELSDSAVVEIVVTAAPDPLEALAQQLALNEDNALDLLLAGSGGNGNAYTFALVDLPVNGSLSGDAPNLTYTPNENYVGSDTLTFTVSDGEGVSNAASISITVAPVNDAPVADSQSITTDEDTPVDITLSASDADGDALSYSIVEAPSSGVLSGTAPNLVFTPEQDFFGTVEFRFTASDGLLESDAVVVSIDVTPVNDVPVAQAQSLEVLSGESVAFTPAAIDVEDDTLSFEVISAPSEGTLESSAPDWLYTAADNFEGTVTIEFVANDGVANSAPVSIDIVITKANEAPVADDIAVTVETGSSVAVLLLAQDVDNDVLSYLIASEPQNGSLSGSAPELTYTPIVGYVGSDVFTYTANDGFIDSNTGTVTITVNALPNTAPVANIVATTSVQVGTELNLDGSGSNDGEGDTLTYAWALVSQPQNANAALTNTDSPLAALTGNVAGEYVVELVVNDGEFDSAPETITVTMTAISLPPVTYTGTEFLLTFDNNSGSGTAERKIFVSSEFAFTGTVEFPGRGEPVTFFGDAGTVATIPIEREIVSSGVLSQHAIRVTTDREASLYAINAQEFSTDAFLVLPITALGTQYVLPSFYDNAQGGADTQFSIVGNEDQTLIDITARGDLIYYGIIENNLQFAEKRRLIPRGETLQVQLNKDQTLSFSGANRVDDFTGTLINASKPVAVFSGHKCSFVPLRVRACDHLIEQIPSTDTLGDYYITQPLSTRVGGDTFRAVAYTDNTVVKINDQIVANLNQGEFHEQLIEGAAIVESNQPFLLVQYSNGASFDADDRVTLENYNAGVRFDGDLRETPENYADPFMIVVPPVSQYLSEYIVTTPTTTLPFHFVNLVVPSSAIATITMDGVALDSAIFTAVDQSGFFSASVPISEGSHSFKSSSRFGLYVYGFGEWVSYGYLGGMALNNRTVPVASLDIQLTNDGAGEVGSTTCVVSTVTDGVGNPIHNTNVDVSVSGNSVQSKRVFTNANGVAEFCYAGLSTGTDLISVSNGSISATESFTWLVNNSDANIAPKITSLPTTRVYAGDSYVYEIQVQDANADNVAVTVTGLPSGAAFDSNTNTINWSVPTILAPGAQGSVVVRADDGRGGVDEQRYDLDSLGIPNEPPAIDGLTRYGFIVGALGNSQFTPTYVPNESLVHDIENKPDGMTASTNAGAGVLRWYPNIDQVGEHEITLVVSAGRENGVARKPVTIYVTETNTIPEIRNTPPANVLLGDTIIFNPNAFDADGHELSYDVSVKYFTAEEDISLDPVTGRVIWEPSRVGTFGWSIFVSDVYSSKFYSFATKVKASNTDPQIISSANTRAVVGQSYEYAVIAEDPDNDALTYSLTTAPAGMSISDTGVISWTPTESLIGDHLVTIRVRDGFGGIASQLFTLNVVGANAAPVITSTPPNSAVVGAEYQYAIIANDIDNDVLSYALANAPAGMNIDAQTGIITWTPGAEQVGAFNTTVSVSDGIDTGEQLISGEVVLAPNLAPTITSTAPQNAYVGKVLSYALTVTDPENDALTYAIVDGPADATVSAEGVFEWTPTEVGTGSQVVTLSVSDSVNEVAQSFTLQISTDNDSPIIEITSPEHLSDVTTIVSILGSVSDANLTSWRLVAQRNGTEEVIELNEGVTAVTDDVLGEFDPTMLINGLYTIAVLAVDDAGNETTDGIVVIVDGNLKVGNFTITFNDLTIPMMGIPIEVNRTYDSRRRHEDLDFGYGWSIDYQNVEITESRVPGKGWSFNEYTAGVVFGDAPAFCVEPLGTPIITVRLPDDKLEEFDIVLEDPCHPIAVLDGRLSFKPRDGTTSELKSLENVFGRIDVATGEIAPLAGDILNPNRYELTTKAGYVYVIDQEFGIETITDLNGNVLTYSDTGIAHSAGKNIDFVRDENGRIIEIIDPKSNIISYNYDVARDLIAVTDREFATTEFTYNENHGLVDIIDPLGRRIVRNIYDDNGRLTAQEDNEGNKTDFSHDLEGKESVVTDRLGRNTVFFYDDRGNVTSEVDALGHTFSYTYDEFDNLLSETNPLGHITTATFDDRYNQLTKTDALGNTISYEYNSLGQETLITDARGNSFTNVYGPVGNLLSVTDPLGHQGRQNIGSNGLVLLRQDGEGHNTSFEYDTEGNITKETDAEGGVTTYTYDENNNLLTESHLRTENGVSTTDTITYEYNDRDQVTKTIDALGNVSSIEYDLLGRVITEVDAKDRRTFRKYDSYGRLTSTTYPDGTSDTSTFDLEGNKLSDTDRLGRITAFTIDALNREVSTRYADNTVSSVAYDAAGRMVSETDARGNTRTHTYDAANRRISTIDAAGNTVSYGYDVDGNMTTQTDARGNTTNYTYNALNHRVLTTFADNSEMSTVFDKRGLKIRQSDQNGRTTRFSYDGLRRLVSVTDALNQVTEYSYDEVGNKLTQTDALDRVTTWTYDALNRPVSRTLPMGQTETYAYDAVGNRTSHTDFNGATHTFEYDEFNDWLVTQRWADGKTTIFGYNAIGQRTSASDNNGAYSYSYDNRNRLMREVKHNGSELLYGYDGAGNRTTLTTLVAGVSNTATYTFDALNRMSSVTDADGNTTSYSFDANSNQTRIDHANGTASTMLFDALNRVTTITHLGTANQTLASLSYSLDDTGRRTTITESTGRSSAYTYDELYRLTSESIIDPQVGNHSASFEYNAVSNRISDTVNGITTGYTFDDNDRLTANGLNTYTYDDNGNTVSEVVDGQSNSYSYDSQNRLVQASMGGVVQAMSYDPDGIRIEKSLGGVTTDYLTDTNRAYAQVLHESTPTTEFQYTFGLDLVGMNTGTENFTYHSDALGSTRLLTNNAGQVADDVRYDAWGEQLAGGDVAENQYLFTGEQFDSRLDNVYLRARYYSPQIGRFSQMDEWLGLVKDPITLNKYAYAAQNPQYYVDPTGNSFTLRQIGIASAVLSAMILTAEAQRQQVVGISIAPGRPDNGKKPPDSDPGLVIIATLSYMSTTAFDRFNIRRRERRDDLCGYAHGPFYRYELKEESYMTLLSGWLYGRTPQGGIEPTAQAYRNPKARPMGVKFCTVVEPENNGDRLEARWYKRTPNVEIVDDETVRIPIIPKEWTGL